MVKEDIKLDIIITISKHPQDFTVLTNCLTKMNNKVLKAFTRRITTVIINEDWPISPFLFVYWNVTLISYHTTEPILKITSFIIRA